MPAAHLGGREQGQQRVGLFHIADYQGRGQEHTSNQQVSSCPKGSCSRHSRDRPALALPRTVTAQQCGGGAPPVEEDGGAFSQAARRLAARQQVQQGRFAVSRRERNSHISAGDALQTAPGMWCTHNHLTAPYPSPPRPQSQCHPPASPTARGPHERRQLLGRHVAAHVTQQRLPMAPPAAPSAHFVGDVAKHNRLLLRAAPLAHCTCTGGRHGRFVRVSQGTLWFAACEACCFPQQHGGGMNSVRLLRVPGSALLLLVAPEAEGGEPSSASQL